MSCVNWNRRYLQDLSAVGHHQDFQDKQHIAVRKVLYLRTSLNDSPLSYSFNKELHLSFNFIPELSQGTLEGFTSLNVLSLSCNCLTGIPSELKYVPTLTELNLSNNQIHEIEHLETLVELKHLNLRCNRISWISNLKSNVALERLTLSNNKIGGVCWDQLSELKRLTFLGLYNNQLQFVDVLKLIGMAPLLTEAFLGGNPFSDGQPLTVASALMSTSGHLDEIETCKFVSLLRKKLQDPYTSSTTPTSDIAAALCHGQTNAKAQQRLLLVVDRLEQIRLVSPCLLKVDGERIVQ